MFLGPYVRQFMTALWYLNSCGFFKRSSHTCTHTKNNEKILKTIFKEMQVIYQLVTAP